MLHGYRHGLPRRTHRRRTSVEEIRDEIEADSLSNLSIDGIAETLDKRRTDLCLDCVTGEYPYDIEGEATDRELSARISGLNRARLTTSVVGAAQHYVFPTPRQALPIQGRPISRPTSPHGPRSEDDHNWIQHDTPNEQIWGSGTYARPPTTDQMETYYEETLSDEDSAISGRYRPGRESRPGRGADRAGRTRRYDGPRHGARHSRTGILA